MDYEQQASFLKAMSHPARLRILNILRHGETCVCHLEKAIGRRQAYISQQLMTLRQNGLVESRQMGVYAFYRIADERIYPVLESICDSTEIDQLEARDDCGCMLCELLRMRDKPDA